MDDLHEIESVQHCDGFQFNIITKNYILGFYSTNKVGTLWSVLYFYCNWQLSAKKKKKPTWEWEGMGVILPGVERDFPPVFSWDWDGKRLIFVGVRRERFENSLPCHPLLRTCVYA